MGLSEEIEANVSRLCWGRVCRGRVRQATMARAAWLGGGSWAEFSTHPARNWLLFLLAL